MTRLSALDAVTIDAYGTLVELRDPVGALHALVPERARDEVERAFRAEAEHYVAHAHEGRNPKAVADLRAACTDVFNRELGSDLTPERFMGALVFEPIPGAVEAVEALRSRGLALAVASNWDASLVELLADLDVPVVTSAEAAAPKPDPAIFRLALERLRVQPHRALHVGDHENDRRGAEAVGMQFAWAPLTEAVAAWA